ncbi:MAG: 4Fe-4S dicluster domain-containing protein [Clostridia bacterium]|nr:4Fe-4S dicluster domain-containing protein [Clostridia bacterium]
MIKMRRMTRPDGVCDYCGRCAPCPKGIPISEVMKLIDVVDEPNAASSRELDGYAALPKRADSCVACRQCETRCPRCVSIVSAMRRADRVFGCHVITHLRRPAYDL